MSEDDVKKALMSAALTGLLSVVSGCNTSHTPPRDAICDVDPARMVTSREQRPGMTFEQFAAMCDASGGFIQTHPHCGGFNSCRGFSYDQTTTTFTTHTCAGLNTCTGWTCVED
jgi:hypothetical protein